MNAPTLFDPPPDEHDLAGYEFTGERGPLVVVGASFIPGYVDVRQPDGTLTVRPTEQLRQRRLAEREPE